MGDNDREPAELAPANSVEDLVAQLTLDEKAALCHGRDAWTIDGCERLGIPAWTVSDGPIGIRGRGMAPTACFPSASAIAASFDLDLVRDLGAAIGREANAKSIRMALGPTVNLHRHPLTGRHFECYSEDPELTAQVAVAYVEGVQSTGVGACIKHYVANDQEHERLTISADVDERTLRELYLRPFEAAVEAGVWGVMGAYNFVNGVHACAHPELLQAVLKDEWGFTGVVVSDWGALKDGAGPGRYGLDLEMPGPGTFWGGGQLAGLVRADDVPEAEVDDKARRILRFLDWCGALDEPASDAEASLDTPEQRAVARRAAVASMVLLRNNGVLPLDPQALRSVAVIGPNAEETAVLGGGSATVLPYYRVSVLDALAERLGDVEVHYEEGCSIRRVVPHIEEADLGPERFTVEVFEGTEATGEPVAVLEHHDSRGILGSGNWPEEVKPPLLVRARGTFIAPSAGTWRFAGGGLHHARLAIDGEYLTDNQAAGAISAGLGNHLGVTERVVEEGQHVELTLDYDLPAAGMQLVLFTVGAGLVGLDPEAEAEGRLAAAAETAAGADVAVVVVGSNHEWESEGADRTDLDLPGDQEELVRRVAAANPRTIVVHNSGSPMAMPWVDDVAAIVQAWYPGQEAGNAVADVLLGDADPGGRMPTTWPKRIEDTPAFDHYPGEDGHVVYGEGLLLGHRWYEDQGIEPLWAFGHGLSYATFEWTDPMVEPGQASVRVRNTGDRAGVEVVQAYVAGDDRPSTLAGFARVALEPGDEAVVTVPLSSATFRRWVPGIGWTTGGEYEVRLARSARDVVQTASVTR